MPESQALYARQIKAIFKTASGRNGYMGYYEARHVGNAVHDLVSLAEKSVEISNYQTAMFIACAVFGGDD